jgi:hypothetical protein
MASCVTCGDDLHPERAAKYDYCTKSECQQQNARGLRMVAVGVNKAADQYEVLNERTKREMIQGRYQKEPDFPRRPRRGSRPARAGSPGPAPILVPRASTSGPRWSEAQERLALVYRDMGLNPDQIASKVGVSRYLVTQILIASPKRRLSRNPTDLH